jgi:hypothetical protein
MTISERCFYYFLLCVVRHKIPPGALFWSRSTFTACYTTGDRGEYKYHQTSSRCVRNDLAFFQSHCLYRRSHAAASLAFWNSSTIHESGPRDGASFDTSSSDSLPALSQPSMRWISGSSFAPVALALFQPRCLSGRNQTATFPNTFEIFLGRHDSLFSPTDAPELNFMRPFIHCLPPVHSGVR